MKKLFNPIFFGSCFMATMLIEAYSIQILEGNLFITAGIGIVVLITGYLLMDSIRSLLVRNREGVKFYMDRVHSEENEKWSERYTELVNLSKASYTATKKNTAMQSEQFDEILSRLEAMENDNAKAWQKIMELQKKSLEGQKNALNLEISYNKENTKRLIGLFRGKENEVSEQIAEILSLLEKNNELLQSGIKLSESPNTDLYQELEIADHIDEEVQEEENTSETGWLMESEPVSEADNPKIVPLYDDPNKTLTADEIAALFANYGR